MQKKSPLPDQAKVTSLNDCSIAKSSRTNRSPITCPRKEDSPDRIVLDIPVLGCEYDFKNVLQYTTHSGASSVHVMFVAGR